MHNQVHKLTAIFLVLLYTAVGLTGESLHYLVEPYLGELQGQVALVDEEPSVYFHSHGHDFHLHSHRIAKKPSTKSNPTKSFSQKISDPKHPSFLTPSATHKDHDCPLLTVVSNLKQGIGGAPSDFLAPGADSFSACESKALFSQVDLRSQLPRGPPL